MKLTESRLREVIRSMIEKEEKSIKEGLDFNYLNQIHGFYGDSMSKIDSKLDKCESVEEVKEVIKEINNINYKLIDYIIKEVR